MEKLLKPDVGLAFWTLINFAVLTFVLYKVAWKPLLKAIQKREQSIKQNIETAQSIKTHTQRMHLELEQKIKNLAVEKSEIIQQAQKNALAQQGKILEEAKLKAQNMLSRAKDDLSREKDRLSQELKKDVVDIAIMAAQKIITKELDKKTNEKIVTKLLKDLNERQVENAKN